MAQVRTFDPKLVVLVVGGIPIAGYPDGTFLEYEDDEDAYEKETGVDGFTTRVKSNNNGGKLTITLSQSSPSNDVLSTFANADKLSNTGVVPVLLKDLGGTTAVFSPSAWVQKKASSPFAKSIQARQWILDMADVDSHIGGNIL